ncbi:DNA-binding transcriptional regulator, MarR family [Sanguibacter gelidistatuariae]|uniref:DNA-binding transcriptional regulator, MarR family n=1 Tax=Sanguibacter gelidistatuariae TaxID=1814289 RepID=A0A1G6RTE1_9MICO|nr:MarR family winged helix-turn-helix transcriptional regulator [Sanguibacter gelidistatuariae]SDD07818.1 DNA-binding transcriptional regulator, MarR family [Sanguibacter gelidistatuariae]
MAVDETSATGEQHGYWYDDHDPVVAILHAVRKFRRSDQDMRRRMSADMDMNESDMQALQIVIAAESSHQLVTPRDLSAALAISTASTTKLLDRLTASGHLERHPHPTDRRALVITATDHAHNEIRDRLERMHAAMREIAAGVPEPSRRDVADFLVRMSAHLDSEGGRPLTPRP